MLAGCSPTGHCDPGVPSGTIEANVGGTAWSSSATWQMAGSSLQITAAPAAGWFMSFVAQQTTDGETVGDAFDAGGNFAVELQTGAEGGFATLYPSSGTSYPSDPIGGLLRILDHDDQNVTACFAFTGTNGDGAQVDVKGGSLHAIAP